ncbi:hypothetical protein GE061_019065 [Apolygus lucorum]|uniref:Uncharacterized protein n=1 Tax=Apolygus lucorum TaxID=248454 RepID=A0A6A4JTU2_APOLU|nr:hypothetical protein GE061_019065 [Apolygus lucorum]
MAPNLSSEQLTGGELIRSNSQEPFEKSDKLKKNKSKKTPWTWLYPTYKSRSDDFKRLFKDIPADERLVVDYSCAIQRDILVHGRLYVSPNYLCFYANIFRWETQVVFKWKEVTALTKEKTALVIPNAIFVHIGNEKHFLTSFASRDKAYLMLFRVWQNALMDQPMSTQEMWTWVHSCYGEELGLTSDDDDYVAPPATLDGERNLNNNKKDSTNDIIEHLTNESEKNVDKNSNPHVSRDGSAGANEAADTVAPNASGQSASDQPQSDVTDSSGSESESEKNDKPLGAIKCPAAHEGRLMLHMQVAIHVDQLFSHLFTNSKFLLDLHEIRKSTDIKQSAWTVNPITNQKGRTVSLTITLGQAIGPKHAQVTESQKMLPCSTPGEIYSIEIEASNAGVPYSDTFYVISHYCLTRGSDPNTSTIAVYCQIKYRKSVWGIVKSYIEKHCWQGIEDYFNDLVKALESECERTRRTMTSLPGTKRKGIRRRRSGAKKQALPLPDVEEKPLVQPLVLPTQTTPHFPQNADTLAWIVFLTLFLLLVLNAALYYKLWGLEQSERRLYDPTSDLDMDNFRFAPRTPEEWRTLVQKQEQLHAFEVERWLRILKASVHLLQQVENSLTGLQESIQGAMGDSLTGVNDAASDSPPPDNSDL